MNYCNLMSIFMLCSVSAHAMEDQPDISFGETITPDIISSLESSYRSDTPEFSPIKRLAFVERKHFDELDILNEIFFPKYWNQPDLPTNPKTISVKLHGLAVTLAKCIEPYMQENAPINKTARELLKTLPTIRESLKKDVQAAYAGDPAAKSYGEIIRCYPGFLCMVVQRVAHQLYKLNVPVYPRELTELAHNLTGIDIHPGADIGQYFFLDHGTGTVIGETCTIGDWCRLYQGVTLGALHFEQDEESHMLKKGYKRHPTLANHVVVGAGAKILGDISIGDHVSIGANCWVQTDIEPDRTVYIGQHPQQVVKEHKKDDSQK